MTLGDRTVVEKAKNLSTIVCELLDTNITLTEPISEEIKQYFGNSPTTYAKAVAIAMMIKAINSDVRAAAWISNYADRQPPDETDTGFFSQPVTIFEVVPNRPRPKEES